MQNGEWITVHIMQSSTKEYDLFAFHKTTEMQRRIQSYEERLMLLTGQLHPRVRAAGKGGLRRHRARGV